MEIEKVKEIKKALEERIQHKPINCCNGEYVEACGMYCRFYRKFVADMGSKNGQTCENCIDFTATDKVKECVDVLTYINELENLCNKNYEDLTKEIDRLEKENARLTNITPYQVVISDTKFEELKKNAIKDINLTKIMLKQFAERLKEKMGVREYMGVKYKQGVFSENDIDEILKEFLL